MIKLFIPATGGDDRQRLLIAGGVDATQREIQVCLRSIEHWCRRLAWRLSKDVQRGDSSGIIRDFFVRDRLDLRV
jgi:hypothetical protein